MIQARCAVCGTDLKGALRACARCETIYHRDCWAYNGGCAIYGCRRVAVRQAKPAPMPAWQGPAFGALLGTAVMSWFFHIALPRANAGALFYVTCAAVLGFVSGSLLRESRSAGRIALLGLLGPGLTFSALVAPLAPWMEPGALLLAPLFVLCGVIAAPLALPCAVLAARFSDPELQGVHRQRMWLILALTAALAGLVQLASAL